MKELRWGSGLCQVTIAGFRRVELDSDAAQQREKDALFTIGRLARLGHITLYTYSELNAELWRRPKGKEPLLNAFLKCRLQHCQAPIERTKFRASIDMSQWIAKGGRSDRKNGSRPSEFGQVPFFEWLANLSPGEIAACTSHSKLLRVDDFEVLSLHDLPWFQALSRALANTEHLPDCFHIWTARRNAMDAFLTLEKKLPRTLDQLGKQKQGAIHIGVPVLRPTELLNRLGVTEIDRVPIESGRFYSYAEIFATQDRLLNSHIEFQCPIASKPTHHDRCWRTYTGHGELTPDQ